MVIKEENQAVDIQKDNHVSWEGQKENRRFYVKKTISYGKWSGHQDPQNIPSVSWEGGTSVVCKVWFERTNTIREGFNTWTEVEKKYIHYNSSGQKNATIQGSDETGYSVTFSKRDDASSDLQVMLHYFFDVSHDDYTYNNLYTGKYIYIMCTYIQTKRDKYVTKIDNAVITVDNIPAVGGNVNKGTLTYTKTYNTGETEQGSETVTFPTVSATTKGTTESGVTDVKTIEAGGTTTKTTTIDGVTLTHPAFTVKQDANVKTVKTAEYKTTESVILQVSPTVVYSSGGTVTFSLSRKYTLHKAEYQYSSGSTSGGGTDTGQGPETVNANYNYKVIFNNKVVDKVRGDSYEIRETTEARTVNFQTTYDSIDSNIAMVTQKLDGPDESKAFYYTNLEITEYSYAKDDSGYHFPASGKTITATNCTLKGTYIWHYTSMEGKTAYETVNWSFNNLTSSMYKFSESTITVGSLGTTTAQADNSYKTLKVSLKNFIHVYNDKQYDVKDNKGTALTAEKSVTLTRQGNSGTQASTEKSSKLNVSVNPTTYNYKGGSATLSSKLIKIYDVSWTSGATSEKSTSTDVTSSTTFTGSYTIGTDKTTHSITVSNASVTIPNLGTSKDTRKYTFTGNYNNTLTGTATLTQTGNTTLYTVKFYKNNDYAKWYRNGSAINDDPVDAQFSESTSYTSLTPNETPTWIEGSNYKYTFTGKYSTTPNGKAVSNSNTLTDNLSLYALWSTPDTGSIKVTWQAGEGTFKKVSSNETAKTVYHYYKEQSDNVTIQLTDEGYNNTPVAPKDYTFTGWNKADSMPCQFNLTKPTTFNAQYTTTSKTIYWNSNGGTFSDGTTQKSETKDYGSKIDSGYTPAPSKTNTASISYTFKGWSLTTDGSTVAFPYTITTTDESITFYAQYSSSTVQHTVTWTSYPANVKIFTDGTSSKSNKFDHDTVYSSLTAPYTLATLPNYNNRSESDSTIKYSDSTGEWYTTKTESTTLSGNSTKLINDITVYRHITVEYKVILNCNNGQKSSTDTGTSWSVWKTGSLNLGSYTPYRSGYNFKGWGDTNTSTSGSTSTVNINKSTTYYAVWKQVFTVTWNLQGGTVNSSTSNPTQSVESGGTVSFGTYTPTKSGYTFQGWAEASSATSGSTSGNSSAITSNKTFYAIWKSATLTPILLIIAS